MGIAIPRIKEFPADGRYWRVDWYGAVERNHNVPSEPHFQVIASPLLTSAPSSSSPKDLASMKAVPLGKQRTIRIGIGQLPLIIIGSIWRNGVCQPQQAGEMETLEEIPINLLSTRPVLASHGEGSRRLIPDNYYNCGTAGASSRLMVIERDRDPFGILIPMLELVRFYYAASTDLARAVFSGAFRHDLSSVVNLQRTGSVPEEKRYQLGVRRDYTNEDGWVLARILSSPQAWKGATSIHDQMMMHSLNRDSVHLETRFPFTGSTTLRANCKWIKSSLDDKWRCLVLSLQKCNAPFPFENLTVIRDNDGNKANPLTDLPPDEKKPAFAMKRPSNRDLSKKRLQSAQEPDKGFSAVTISLPSSRFGAIEGKKPEMIEKEQCKYKHLPVAVEELDVEDLGTGEGGYGGAGVGRAKISLSDEKKISNRRRALPASFVVFKEAIRILNERPGISASLRELDEDTQYIPLTKEEGKAQWAYLDSSLGERRRVIAADIKNKESESLVVEFELRSSDKCKVALLSRVDGKYLGSKTLLHVLTELSKKRGIWINIPKQHILGIAITALKHTWSCGEEYADALEKKLTS